MRFRRSVKILPSVPFNFGTRGVSTSVGVLGAHVTFSKSGTRTTALIAALMAAPGQDALAQNPAKSSSGLTVYDGV